MGSALPKGKLKLDEGHPCGFESAPRFEGGARLRCVIEDESSSSSEMGVESSHTT
jgi:hypothetical protein